ncbi:carbohydrate-binding module family 50 protein [Apiospora rasikravindrae]|uniref:Carbohydrate-binding module family 50 protein n=1 Tax=Apiospora rasikravindrae TaxID=990691 RepID=A0ABR1SR42_9PEZI
MRTSPPPTPTRRPPPAPPSTTSMRSCTSSITKAASTGPAPRRREPRKASRPTATDGALVGAGDGCDSFANEAGIDVNQFYRWNPDRSSGFWMGHGE